MEENEKTPQGVSFQEESFSNVKSGLSIDAHISREKRLKQSLGNKRLEELVIVICDELEKSNLNHTPMVLEELFLFIREIDHLRRFRL